ncbi:MAG: diacylglycerol kinase family protein [Sulfurovum sp.]|nr:diacylglycerol kinase family protein [Sulfurovum sp.]
MKLLSIGKTITHDTLDIDSISESLLSKDTSLEAYDYIIIHGGDGTIRRVTTLIHHLPHHAKIILNPIGSFNVIAKIHKVPSLESVLTRLSKQETLPTQKHHYFSLNHEMFLFSAGNMGDLQHILLAETLRLGILKKGILKYLLSILFLLPLHLILTPFMLFSSKRFFIFTPARFIKKLGSFRGEVVAMSVNVENHYNFIELDGDIVLIKDAIFKIKPEGYIQIVVKTKKP